MKSLVVHQLAVTVVQYLRLPRLARVVFGGVYNGTPAIWVVEDSDNQLRERAIYVVAQGNAADDFADLPMVGAAVLSGVTYLIFDDGEPAEADAT
jgi:hypothetical protein